MSLSVQTPLVSIIIPTYNRAQLIGETLDSVLAQTYTNWECIVVDDGSTDGTGKLLATYCKKDARFQYHHRPKDRPKGANACRNYGFELSKGEYVNWFDSDDLMVENKLEFQVNKLKVSNLNFSICQTLVFENEIDNIIGLRKDKIYSIDFFNDFIINDIKWLTQAPLIKRKFLVKNSIEYDESLMQSQERDYFIKILSLVDDYLHDDTPLVLFRKHEDSISHGKYTKDKMESNFKVNYNILKNYNNRLNNETILKLRKSLKSNLKSAIIENMPDLTYKFWVLLNKEVLELKFSERIKLFLGIYSMKYFKRGEIFFK
tara:strand:- start:48643 stop:49593 length:951 start_codon:yes stop_codon:yes gene_type:complete